MRRTLGLSALLLAAMTAGLFACRTLPVGNESIAAKVGPRENDAAECATCHRDAAARYASSAHAARHIACGQCHGGAEHPAADAPVTDGTCAGCHMSQYQAQLDSAHFARRALVDLPEQLAGEKGPSFLAHRGAAFLFVGQRGEGGPGGVLCSACHYAGHSFSLVTVRQNGTCEVCHAGLTNHYPAGDQETGNRCLPCHVFAGRTAAGQIVNSHRFAVPRGTEP